MPSYTSGRQSQDRSKAKNWRLVGTEVSFLISRNLGDSEGKIRKTVRRNLEIEYFLKVTKNRIKQ